MITKQGRSGRINPYPMHDVERDARAACCGTRSCRRRWWPCCRAPSPAAPITRRSWSSAATGSATSSSGTAPPASPAGCEPRASGAATASRSACGNGLDWAFAFFGIQLAGAVAVPVNTRFTDAEVEYVVSDSGSRVVLEPGAPLPTATPLVVDDAAPADLAAIFYTSGTTGFPKGAMTTHENFLSNCETCRRVIGFPGDGELAQPGLGAAVPRHRLQQPAAVTDDARRHDVVIMPAFDVQAFLRATVDERINVLTSVPAIYWLAMNQPNFADFDMTGVRWLSYGGAPMRARRHRPAPHGVPQRSRRQRLRPHRDVVGVDVPAARVLRGRARDRRIRRAGGRGRPRRRRRRDGVGELLIRGPNIVAGYWNKPEQTAETFVDGWLHSGDLARIDDEGFVQIVDRKKDMVNRGGENVYCVEVENALAAAPGGVRGRGGRRARRDDGREGRRRRRARTRAWS